MAIPISLPLGWKVLRNLQKHRLVEKGESRRAGNEERKT